MTCEEKKMVAPRAVASRQQRPDGLLRERVEPGGRLIENQHRGPRHQRKKKAELLSVTLGVRPCVAREVELQPVRKQVNVGRVYWASSNAGEEGDHLGAAQPGIEAEVSGQIAYERTSITRPPLAVDTQNAGPARRRADEVKQQPNRGGLTGAVRTKKAEDFALFHLQGESIECPERTEVLSQPLGQNCWLHHDTPGARSGLPLPQPNQYCLPSIGPNGRIP